jgi:hypothetical protein
MPVYRRSSEGFELTPAVFVFGLRDSTARPVRADRRVPLGYRHENVGASPPRRCTALIQRRKLYRSNS